MDTDDIFAGFFIVCIIAGIIILLNIVLAIIGACLWNMVVPQVFGLPQIDWLQMLILMFVAMILLPSNTITKTLYKKAKEQK